MSPEYNAAVAEGLARALNGILAEIHETHSPRQTICDMAGWMVVNGATDILAHLSREVRREEQEGLLALDYEDEAERQIKEAIIARKDVEK